MGFKVYKTPCKNCLLTEERIVSPERKNEIIAEIAQQRNYFVCHKASMNEEEVCCKLFFDQMEGLSQHIQVAKMLGVVEFVEQPDHEKLTPWKNTEQAKRRYEQPDYEPEDCECKIELEEEGSIEYTKDFSAYNGTWVCDHCGRAQ